MIKNKKGQNVLDGLSSAGIGLLTVAIVLVIGFIFVDSIDNNVCPGFVNTTNNQCQQFESIGNNTINIGANNTAWLASQNITRGMSNVTEQLPLLGLVIGLGAVFVVALGAFAAKKYL